MLTCLSDYHSYINHLISFYDEYKTLFDYRLNNVSFNKALCKMIALDVDSVIPFMHSFYSNIGRPASHQIEILRSLVLMAHFRCFSPKKWVKKLRNDKLLALLSGFNPDDIPSFSSFYDFFNRFYCSSTLHRTDYILESKHFSYDKKNKPKNHSKLVNFTPDDTHSLYQLYLKNIDHTEQLEERPLLYLFNMLGVEFSFTHHLLDNHIIISGDGSASKTHSNPYGTKIDDNHNRYSDIDADFGWDSDLERFYFGYTSFNISCIHHKYNIDLPLFLTLAKASRHDALTSMSALSQFKSINTSLSISHYCLDSASDNYSTHKLAYSFGIIPIIDINKRNTGNNVYEPYKDISENGRPICMGGYETVRDGFDRKRYRHKFRCPFAQRIGENPCPCKDKCSNSPYGRVFHIKSDTDIKLFGPVPYKSEQWKLIYKDRTCTERINTRILNDYKFTDCRMHGRKRNFFMLVMIGINIHLDAYNKVSSM